MSRTLSLSTSAFSPEVFAPVKLSGKEYLNELFEYQLVIKTPDLEGHEFYAQYGSKSPAGNVDLTAWLGQSVTVNIELDGKEVTKSDVSRTIRYHYQETVGKGVRHINGVITGAQFLYNQGRSAYYLLEISPFLHAATLCQNWRIYQDKTVLEIIDELLQDYPGTVDKRLEEQKTDRYPKRDYQTQYGETDYDFLIRLLSEWGICHWYEHSADGHTLVLSDEPQNHQQMPSEAYQKLSYYQQGHKINEEYLHEFNLIARSVSGAFASADYDYARASSQILEGKHNIQPYPEAQKQGIATGNTSEEKVPQKGEIFDYAADVVQAEAGPNQEGNNALGEQLLRNQWNLERLQQQHVTAKARGNIRGLITGYQFALEKHPSTLANINWTVKGTELLVMDLAEESQRKENGLESLLSTGNITGIVQVGLDKLLGNSNQQWLIDCQAKLIPANIPVRPKRIEKPKGTLQNALVVGEAEAGSIYTDSYGRIKIQFYWDRYHSKDQNSSCWIRVNEPWAGNQMGAVFTPRIGQEVLVDFINHDPDLPICIGKVNNSDNMPPWALAQNKSLSGFRSRELPEGNSHSGRSNHLVFDDTEGKIQTQLKSDHAHSQLSLGEITRIEDNQGRKDARGHGFELRTDDWGAVRASKGLYLSTYDRNRAQGQVMDAKEAVKLLDKSKELSKELSENASSHNCEQLTGVEHLQQFLEGHLSSLYARIKDLESQIGKDAVGANSDSQEEAQTDQFDQAALVVASPKSIAITTPETIYTHSDEDTHIVSRQNLNLAVGKNLLSSVAEKISLYAQLGIKVFSGSEKIEVQAQNNDIDLIAKKVINLISTEDWVKVNAKKGILLNAGTSYIKITPEGIEHGTTGQWKVYSANKEMMGPKSMSQAFQEMPQTSFNDEYTLLDEITGKPLANYKVDVIRADGSMMEVVTNAQGRIELMKSEFPENVKMVIKGKIKS